MEPAVDLEPSDPIGDIKLEMIDARLAKLERSVMGPHSVDGVMTWLTEDIQDDKTLIAAARNLKSTIQSLDCSSAINSEAVQSFLASISKLPDRSQLADELQNEKVKVLSEMIRKFDSNADLIPMLMDRLATLKSVHQRVSSFDELLNTVDSDQSILKNLLSSINENIDRLKEHVQQSLTEYGSKLDECSKLISLKMNKD
ncbi:hypothetical protein ACOME3_006482 [Neoechinorhynchus agilis]